MSCPKCGHDGQPFIEFGIAGVTRMCSNPECCAILPDEPEERTPASAVPPRTRTAQQKAPRSEAFDVIKAARTRLRELEREIKKLEALTKERDKLKRLLDAADKPLAPVRPLRANQG